MNVFKLIFKIPYIKSSWQSFGLFMIRVVAGLSIAFAHGKGKLPPSEGFIKGVGEDMGFMPGFFAWSAGLSEFAGGILIALGLLTRPAAFFAAITMAVAFFIHHADDPFARKEKALLFLAIFILILIFGPGKYSLDEKINKRFFL